MGSVTRKWPSGEEIPNEHAVLVFAQCVVPENQHCTCRALVRGKETRCTVWLCVDGRLPPNRVVEKVVACCNTAILRHAQDTRAQHAACCCPFRDAACSVTLPEGNPLLPERKPFQRATTTTTAAVSWFRKCLQGTARPFFQFIQRGQFRHRVGRALVGKENFSYLHGSGEFGPVLRNKTVSMVLQRVSGCVVLRVAPQKPGPLPKLVTPRVVNRKPAAASASLYKELHGKSCDEILQYVAKRGLCDKLFASVLAHNDITRLVEGEGLAKRTRAFLENMCHQFERNSSYLGNYLCEEMQKTATFMRLVVSWTTARGHPFAPLPANYPLAKQREQFGNELRRFFVFQRAQKETNKFFDVAVVSVTLACVRLRTVCHLHTTTPAARQPFEPPCNEQGLHEKRNPGKREEAIRPVNTWDLYVFQGAASVFAQKNLLGKEFMSIVLL